MVRPGGLFSARQRLGEQRAECVSWAGELESGRLAVSGHSDRDQTSGASRRIAECVEPCPVGESGHWFYGSELHAHSQLRRMESAANGAVRRAIRFLSTERAQRREFAVAL